MGSDKATKTSVKPENISKIQSNVVMKIMVSKHFSMHKLLLHFAQRWPYSYFNCNHICNQSSLRSATFLSLFVLAECELKRRSFVSAGVHSKQTAGTFYIWTTHRGCQIESNCRDWRHTNSQKGRGDKRALGYRRRCRHSPLGNTEAGLLLIMKRKILALNITLQETGFNLL